MLKLPHNGVGGRPLGAHRHQAALAWQWRMNRRRRTQAQGLRRPAPAGTLLTDLVAYWDGDSGVATTGELTLLAEESPAYGLTGGPADGPCCTLGEFDAVYSEDAAFFAFSGMTLNAWVKQNEEWGVETLSARTADSWGGITYDLFVMLDAQAAFCGQHTAEGYEWSASGSFPAPVAVGEWHMWTLTMDATRLDAWLDGEWLCGLAKANATELLAGSQFRVKGNHPFGVWSGAWANLGVWGRGLSGAEVAELFNGGSGRTFSEL